VSLRENLATTAGEEEEEEEEERDAPSKDQRVFLANPCRRKE